MTALDTQHTRPPEVRRCGTNVDSIAAALTETSNRSPDPPGNHVLPGERPKAIAGDGPSGTAATDRSIRKPVPKQSANPVNQAFSVAVTPASLQ